MWNRIGVVLGCGSLVALAGCSTTQTRVDALEKEIDGLRQALAVRTEESVSLNELFEVYNQNYNNNAVLAKRYLKTIRLPENPTPGQVDDYLMQLYALRRSGSDEEVITQAIVKIIAIGKENAGKLTPFLDYAPFNRALIMLRGPESKELFRQAIIQNRINHELIQAYIRLLAAEDAEPVLALLPENPGLIGAVTKLGIEQKAKPIVRKMLMDNYGNLGDEQAFFQVVTTGQTPEEFREFADALWKRTLQSGRNNAWLLLERGLALAGRGYRPAYHFLAENYRNAQYGNAVSRMIAISDCGEEDFPAWYKANKDKLQFNPVTNQWSAKPAE